MSKSMNCCIGILFYSLITMISSSQVWMPIVKSIDGTEPMLSEEMKKIIADYSPMIISKQSSIQKIEYDPINGDKDHLIGIDYVFHNGDFGTMNLNLLVALDAQKNDSVINENKLSITLVKDSNVFISNPNEFSSVSNDDKGKEKEKIFNCTYHIPQVNYSLDLIPLNENDSNRIIQKVIRVNKITFALIDYEVDVIEYNGANITFKNIIAFKEEDKDSGREVKENIRDMFVIDQSDINEKYLVLQDDNYLHMYIINNKDNEDIGSLKLLFNCKITYDNNDGKIYKIGLFDNKMIISIVDKGIKSIDINTTVSEVISKTSNEMNMIDFIIDNYSLYAISKGVGLYIYLFYNNHYLNTQIIYHTQMKNIDLYLHPFYGTTFIGISLIQSSPNQEFFLEFIVLNNSKLIPNKILTSNTLHNFLPFYSLDKFNSFFYSNITRTIIIIRRGLLANVNFITYQLPLDMYPQAKTLFSLYDSHNKRHQMALLTNDSRSMIIAKNVSYVNNTLTCSFTSSGIYVLRFIQKSDVCMKSILETAFYSKYCQKVIDIKFNIYMEEDAFAMKLVLGTIIVIFAMTIIGLGVELLRQTRCCKKNVLMIKQPNKKGEYAYIIDDAELNEMNPPWEDRRRHTMFFKNGAVTSRSEKLTIKSERSSDSNNQPKTSKNVDGGSVSSKNVDNNKQLVKKNKNGEVILQERIMNLPGIVKVNKK